MWQKVFLANLAKNKVFLKLLFQVNLIKTVLFLPKRKSKMTLKICKKLELYD